MPLQTNAAAWQRLERLVPERLLAKALLPMFQSLVWKQEPSLLLI